MQSNIDDVRAKIMLLENAQEFDAMAWSRVFSQLGDRPSAMADAKRRMETAISNQKPVIPWDGMVIEFPSVSAETEPTHASV